MFQNLELKPYPLTAILGRSGLALHCVRILVGRILRLEGSYINILRCPNGRNKCLCYVRICWKCIYYYYEGKHIQLGNTLNIRTLQGYRTTKNKNKNKEQNQGIKFSWCLGNLYSKDITDTIPGSFGSYHDFPTEKYIHFANLLWHPFILLSYRKNKVIFQNNWK